MCDTNTNTNTTTAPTVHKCDKCGKICSSAYILIRHIDHSCKNNSNKTPRKDYVKVCKKNLDQNISLNQADNSDKSSNDHVNTTTQVNKNTSDIRYI